MPDTMPSMPPTASSGPAPDASAEASSAEAVSAAQAFFDALDEGRDMPLTSFQESLRSFEVIFAADRSAELGGQPVKVSDLG